MNVIDFFAKIQELFLELPHKFPIPVERHVIACKLHLQKNLKLFEGFLAKLHTKKITRLLIWKENFLKDLLKEKYFRVAYKEIYTK